jgi:formylglycine-generating enzyme required for sulfatase activity
MLMTRIFVSYSRMDETFARQLAASLAQMGADIWMDIEDIPAGLKWSSAIQQGLDAAEVMIVLISPESMASRNVEDEWQYFLDNSKPVIPVLLRQAKIHFQLSRIQYIDFLHQPYDVGMERLKYELARRGFPLGTPMSPPTTPPPQSYSHPVGYNQTYTPPVPSRTQSTGLRRWMIGAGAVGALVLLAMVMLVLNNLNPSTSIDDITLTKNVINPTRIANITESAVAAVQPTQTDFPTLTLTPVPPEASPTPMFTGPVTRNADWTIIQHNFNGVSMVLVPGGRFTMGAGQNQLAAGDAALCEQRLNRQSCTNQILNDEVSTQEVQLTPFWIDTYEVAGADRLPIDNITWAEAQQQCEQRGARLPTEAEWEYASRGPDGWTYPWGYTYDGSKLNVCDKSCFDAPDQRYSWADQSYNDKYPQRAPVGSFPSGRSWVGAEDMAGNLWEWTSTIYSTNILDGYENNSDLTGMRVLKGSSWNWIGVEGRGTARAAATASTAINEGKSPWYGFRCVRDFQPEDQALLSLP